MVAAKTQSIRCRDFSHLSEDDYAYVEEFCRRRGLDLWARHVWARYELDDANRPAVRVRVTIDGMRAIADATGEHGGAKAAVFEWGDDGRPLKATVVVKRRKGGKLATFEGVAYHHNFAPAVITTGSFWEKMPEVMLEKIAESIALRRAYPAQLGNLYTPEETEGMLRRAEPPADAEALTPMQFQLQLIDEGLGQLQQRNEFAALMHARFPGLHERDEDAFYREALACLRESPAAYGVRPQA